MTPNPIKDYYIVYFDILGYKDFFKEQPDKVPELLNSIHDAIRRAKNHIGIANASPLLHGVAGIDIYAKIFSDNILLCMAHPHGRKTRRVDYRRRVFRVEAQLAGYQ